MKRLDLLLKQERKKFSLSVKEESLSIRKNKKDSDWMPSLKLRLLKLNVMPESNNSKKRLNLDAKRMNKELSKPDLNGSKELNKIDLLVKRD